MPKKIAIVMEHCAPTNLTAIDSLSFLLFKKIMRENSLRVISKAGQEFKVDPQSGQFWINSFIADYSESSINEHLHLNEGYLSFKDGFCHANNNDSELTISFTDYNRYPSFNIILSKDVSNAHIEWDGKGNLKGVISSNTKPIIVPKDSSTILILSDGTVLTEKSITSLTLENIKAYKRIIKNDSIILHEFNDIIKQKSDSISAYFHYSDILVRNDLAIKFYKIFLDAFDKQSSYLDNQSVNVSKPNLKDEQSFIEKIVKDFRSYQTDLTKMMDLPVLADFNNPQVSKFNTECVLWDYNQNNFTLKDFIEQWEALKNYAQTMKASLLTLEQRKKLSEARVLLDKALNNASTDNEKDLSVKALTKHLEGVLPLNKYSREWLSSKTGLKELTV